MVMRSMIDSLIIRIYDYKIVLKNQHSMGKSSIHMDGVANYYLKMSIHGRILNILTI